LCYYKAAVATLRSGCGNAMGISERFSKAF
jgi:hypothetical protein